MTPLFRCLLGGIAVVVLGSSAGIAQTPIALRVATLASDSGAQVFYAQDMGFFKRAGLDVTITVMNPAPIPAAVESKTFDIAEINVATLAAAREHGQPFVLIAPSAVYSKKLRPTDGIVVARDSPIRLPRDFNGKTFAVNGLQNIGQVTTEQWIDKNGGDSSTVKFVEMSNSLMVTAIEEGRVDAGEMNEPTLDAALARGERTLGTGYSAVADTFEIGGWFCTGDYAAAHPDIIRKFATVMADTARWANAHQAESGPILEKWTKLTVAPTMPRVTYGERLSAAVTQPLIDVSAKYHLLRQSIAATELFAPGLGAK
jgi:NitT/TauT family transport system substrate-binding protein